MKFLEDFAATIEMRRFWLYSAFIRFQLEHKNARLGYLWEPIILHFVAGMLALVWSRVLIERDSTDYFTYVLFGFALWTLINRLVNKGCNAFISQGRILQFRRLPVSIVAMEQITGCGYNFILLLPFMIGWSIVVFGFSALHILAFLGGLAVVFATAIGFSLSLGIISLFHKDIAQMVRAILRIGFLITPIIWRPERLGENMHLVWLNPFHSFISLCRAPLMGELPPLNAVIISLGICAILAMASLWVVNRYSLNVRKEIFRK